METSHIDYAIYDILRAQPLEQVDHGQLSVLNTLIDIILGLDEEAALQRMTELTRSVMHRSVVCTITKVDLERHACMLVSSAGIPEEKEKAIKAKEFSPASPHGTGFDYELVFRGQEIERYGLHLNGQGLARTQAALDHGIHSLFAVPLKSNDRFVGYFNHFSSQDDPFTDPEKTFLRLVAHFIELAMEKLEHHTDLQVLSRFSQWQLTPGGHPSQLCGQVCEIMRVPVGIVWELDEDNPQTLCVTATTTEADELVRNLRLDLMKHEGLKHHLEARAVGYLADVRRPNPRYEHSLLASERGWVSLLTKPLYAGEHLIGMLDIYSKSERHFATWETRLFDVVGNQLGMYLQRATLHRALLVDDLTQETPERGNRGRIVREYAEIAGAEYGNLLFLNQETHQLESHAVWQADSIMNLRIPLIIAFGEGPSGEAAQKRTTISKSHSDDECGAPEPGRSILAVPMSLDQDLLVFTFGSSVPNAFEKTRAVLESLLRDVPPVIGRLHGREMLRRLAGLATQAQTREDYLLELTRLLPVLMRVSDSVVWLLDKDTDSFRAQFFGHSQSIPTSSNEATVPWDDVASAPLASCFEPVYTTPLNGRHRLAVFVSVDDRVISILELSSQSPIDSWRRSLLESLAQQAAAAIKNISRKQTLERLNQTFADIAQAESEDQLLAIVLECACRLTATGFGSISKLNRASGDLLVVKSSVPVHRDAGKLQRGQGLTGYCLKHLRPVREGNVRHRREYRPFWDGMKSELAVPIFVPAARVRVNAELRSAPLALGVLNVESPTQAAFTAFDEECLTALAGHAAAVLHRLDFEHKLLRLNEAESSLTTEVASNQDWDQIAEKILDAIVNTLGYSHVNLSLVTTDGKRIKTEQVRGSWIQQQEDIDAFVRDANHPLETDPTHPPAAEDIQVHVVQTKQILVPENNDPHFDRKIHLRFRMNRLVRVYIPMILGGVVIGTLEAGYPRRLTRHIYEQDVQILKVFVDYATAAIGRRRRGVLDHFGHEFKDAIRGIQSNTDYLLQNVERVSPDYANVKLNDIMADCEILRTQIGHLEYFLRGRAPLPFIQFTNVGRDVVQKTIKQMRFALKQDRLATNIAFDYEKCRNIRIRTDKSQLCEVMTNLFVNAIKYRNENKLRMAIDVQKRSAVCIIHVRDWGMGVAQGLEEDIFLEGFRTPEAIAKVQGTGYGLYISRQIVRSLGGQLRLSNRANPTEFEIVLPAT
jgi:signal transduction histidine kinase/transcriptional regulator with GAF, ATPase, and Fis domain